MGCGSRGAMMGWGWTGRRGPMIGRGTMGPMTGPIPPMKATDACTRTARRPIKATICET
jgi:hypothetical protein